MTGSLVFLLAGQSNMSGRGSPSAVPVLKDERILVFRRGRLEVASEPLHGDPDAAIGPGMSFAATVLDEKACDRVILVPSAVGGTWINRWVPGADLFSIAAEDVAAALDHGDLGGILWHQGEADAGSPEAASAYAEQMTNVIEGFRRSFQDVTVPFIAGEIGRFLGEYGGCPEFVRVNQSIHDVCRALPGCAVVSSEGLGHVGDYLHFDATSARELGVRYARKWLTLARE